MVEVVAFTESSMRDAAEALSAGRLVAFGTETVYGLGGDATNVDAVARIYAAKGRPRFNPLISHVSSTSAAFALGAASLLAQQLADDFWPGPMTLVLAKRDGCGVVDLACAGLSSIAVRVPRKVEARALLDFVGRPIAAPSANRSGCLSPTKASHVEEELGSCADLAMILDMGAAEEGLESTVIDVRGDVPVVLRPGSITPSMIMCSTGVRAVSGGDVEGADAGGAILSPGQLSSHYAPSKPVRLNVAAAEAGALLIGFGSIEGNIGLNLSPCGDLGEAAVRLYDMLRQADRLAGSEICVAPLVPLTPKAGGSDLGLRQAIEDRLMRAAAPRHAPRHASCCDVRSDDAGGVL